VLDDPTASVKPAAFTWHPRPAYPPGRSDLHAMGYSMRTDRYRYTEWLDQDTGEITATELYNHETGPLASRNLTSDPDYADIVSRLSAGLKGGWKAAIPHERSPAARP
jgi:iduronate 2-sulfatase